MSAWGRSMLVLWVVLAAATVSTGSSAKQAAPTACLPAPTNLVSWWPGDGNANDIKDGNNGTLEGGLGFGTGMVAQAFDLGISNTTKDVLIGNQANLKITAAITVDAWVNRNLMADGQIGIVASKWNGVGAQNAYFLGLRQDPTSQLVHAYGGMGTGSANFFIEGSTAIPPGQWTHLAMTYNSATGDHVLYVDGGVDQMLPGTGNIVGSDATVYLGRQADAANPRHFTGKIDEVEIFNRELAGTEIKAISDAGSFGKCKGAATAVRVWSFAASSSKRGVLISWHAAPQANVLGYNVWRSGVKVNRALVAAKPGRAVYRVVDMRARRGRPYTYRLQAVELDGTRTWLASASS